MGICEGAFPPAKITEYSWWGESNEPPEHLKTDITQLNWKLY